jgi:hypothetical protein
VGRPDLDFMELREEYNHPLPIQRPSSQGDKFIYVDYVNDKPFYVGMGNWGRVRNPDRNDLHVRMLYNLHGKDRWIRRAVARNLSTQDALNLEHTLILCYGRKDIGTGILVNKNNGIGTIDLRNLSTSKPLPKFQPLHLGFAAVAFFLLLMLMLVFLTSQRSQSPTMTGVQSPSVVAVQTTPSPSVTAMPRANRIPDTASILVKEETSDLSRFSGNAEALRNLGRDDAYQYIVEHPATTGALRIGWSRAQKHRLRGNDAKAYANGFGQTIEPNGPYYP